VQAYFDRALGSILLYRMERKQFQDVKSKHEDVPPSEIYGAEHLVRLFGASSLCWHHIAPSSC
jgi:mortality factor 4-like protein 1